MHVVVVGCGRVGSGLAAHPGGRGHTVAVIDKQAKAFRRLPEGFARPHHPGRRLRPRPPPGGRHRGGRRPGGGHQRRQLQHHGGPHRPRGVRARAGDRPHLRPPPGRHLREARHPHHRHRAVDHRSGAAPHPPRRPGHRVDRPVGRRRAGRAPGRRRAGPAGGSPTSTSPGLARVAALSRLGVGQVPDARPRHPGGRRGLHDGGRRPARRARRPPRATAPAPEATA